MRINITVKKKQLKSFSYYCNLIKHKYALKIFNFILFIFCNENHSTNKL